MATTKEETIVEVHSWEEENIESMLTFVFWMFYQRCVLRDVIYSSIYTFSSSITWIAQLACNVCISFYQHLVFPSLCMCMTSISSYYATFSLIDDEKKLSIDSLSWDQRNKWSFRLKNFIINARRRDRLNSMHLTFCFCRWWTTRQTIFDQSKLVWQQIVFSF